LSFSPLLHLSKPSRFQKHHATKKTKPRLFDDKVANQDLQLPGLEYFGRERGMHKLADYARPRFEKLL